jgi:hypothetical protein
MAAPQEFGPSGCGQCGFPKQLHLPTHDFIQPTDAQILARMRNRRALRATPDLMLLPPIGATRLGHALTVCGQSRLATRRAWSTPSRWFCRSCGMFCARSGGIETGAAAIHPCPTYDANGTPL